MSDFSTEGTSGMNSPAGAAGGTPSESDLPGLQGLDAGVDDPDDPTAAGAATGTPLDAVGGAGDTQGGSDPMPDMSGSGS
jgi:hypothetical protein